MPPPTAKAKSRLRLHVQTSLLYAAGGALWFLLSDIALDRIDGQASMLTHIVSPKGMLFVFATALGLYLAASAIVRRLERAEDALRAQEERWKVALETVGDGVWETDLETRQSYYSRKWKTVLGYADEEIGPDMEDWLALIHPDDRARVKDEMKRYLGGEAEVYQCEYRLRTKGGSYRWIMARGSFVAAEDGGKPHRIVGTHTDITARKSIEEQKDGTLAFTKAVIAHSPTGVVVYKATGLTVIANESAARIFGTDVPGLLRQNFRKLESWRPGLLGAAERALATNMEVVYTGATTTTQGRPIWVEAQFVPFLYAGEVHLILMVSDETKKRQTDDQLRLMQSAVEAAPVGWIVTDAVGRIEWVNPGFSTLTGYAPEEVIGQTPSIFKSGAHPPELYAGMWQAIKRGEVWSGALINKRKNGTLCHEFTTIAPVRGADGVIAHFVAIKQDISEQKHLEHQLARTQRLESIGQLATGMVHDLNNMLSPIMLALGLIRSRHADPETLSHVQMMESAAQRGAGVLRQVLTFARGVEGERTDLEPKHLIKEVAELAEETFPRQIKVRTAVAPGTGLVSGDLTQLHQVLLNLAVNARDAMAEGGVLTFHAENTVVDEARAVRQVMHVVPGEYVVLGVRDTGTGISPEVLEHMFEPFYTTKPQGKGTGLGLSTVFGILRSHGGFIEVDTALGRGTDVKVLLRAVVRTDSNPSPAKVAVLPLAGEGRRILVVDDEVAIVGVTCYLLEKRGFVPVKAGDGVEGLAKFRANPDGFSAVILDLMMPNMNGYQLAAEIRRLAPRLPILASTGMSGGTPVEDETVLRALSVYTLLHKPYGERELIEALRCELEERAKN